MAKQLIEKILVAVNGSEESLNALYYAVMMSKEYKCKVSVVYVVDSATLKRLTLSKFFIAEESATYEKALNLEGQRHLDFAKNIAASYKVQVETKLLSGCVWSEIVRYAQDEQSDVILIGKKSSKEIQSSSKYDVVGETYRNLLLNATCNVLVVKEENLEKKIKMYR